MTKRTPRVAAKVSTSHWAATFASASPGAIQTASPARRASSPLNGVNWAGAGVTAKAWAARACAGRTAAATTIAATGRRRLDMMAPEVGCLSAALGR
jgi:hypothetical protein